MKPVSGQQTGGSGADINIIAVTLELLALHVLLYDHNALKTVKVVRSDVLNRHCITSNVLILIFK